MFVKVVSDRDQSYVLHEARLVPCTHVAASILRDDKGCAVGIQVVLHFVDSSLNVTLQLPRDGDVVYFENEDGHSVESARWPPKSLHNEKAFRVTGMSHQ